MPLRQLNAYVAAVPHIRAINALALAEAVAVGVGTMKPELRAETVRRWTSAVRRSRAKPKTPAEIAMAAAASGIGFRRVVRKERRPRG